MTSVAITQMSMYLILALVRLTDCLLQVVRIDKQYEIPPPVPDLNINYHRNLMEKEWRTGLKPLNIVQPEGPSFTVEGNLIKWQKWHIRISFNSREGLVLHNVGCVFLR